MGYAALFFGVKGRFSRSQAWAGIGMCVFLHIAGSSQRTLYAEALPQYGVSALYWPAWGLAVLLKLYVLFLLVAIGIRRCHDRDHRAWWLALGLTLIAIPFLIFDLGFRPGTTGPNRFGPDPLQDEDAILGTFDARHRRVPETDGTPGS